MNKFINSVEYLHKDGLFRLCDPSNIHELYFPLCNEAGLMSSVTPTLHGDIKADQDHFVTAPVTVEDLHSTKSARNFWLYIKGEGAISVTGNSARQNSLRFTDKDNSERIIEAGPLWHKLIYKEKELGLLCEILSFVPANEDKAEITVVSIINQGYKTISYTPTSAIPIYGRSAENIRDHRHVTSLINRLKVIDGGIMVKPVIRFDERGHKYNDTIYYSLGAEGNGSLPKGVFPSVHGFIGATGSFDWPEAVVRNKVPDIATPENIDGMEYVAALRFQEHDLKPGEKKDYILVTGICSHESEISKVFKQYNTALKASKALNENKDYWNDLASRISYESGIENFTPWMNWVSLQPVFRKIYGCSFLPYHDYGKGGRGWRDLWQDCLSLILQNPANVRQLLIDNYAGVRVDGTNATIIGSKQGDFKADRNNIPRVWMDHGAWPYLTTKLYIDQSGDYALLFEKQCYFRDALVFRAAKKDEVWVFENGVKLKCSDGSTYEGTVFEHILVQHLTSFFNVGEHNIIRLEGGDWNDTIDMAKERGESTAFTALYGCNLIDMADLILEASERLNFNEIEIFSELAQLLDTLFQINEENLYPIYSENTSCQNQSQQTDFELSRYDSISYKTDVLNKYLESVSGSLSGNQTLISIKDLANDLRAKGNWIINHIRKNEFITTKDNDGFFNGYYNNDGVRVDGEFHDGIRMNLTAQVFTTMFGLASQDQVKAAYLSCKKYLKDPVTGGYRLNTPLGPNQLNFGRGFAFAYGEKENGSTFCHMAVMYMNALYRRGFVKEAYDIFTSLYELSNNTAVSGIYPGIPEYFNAKGKGLYTYLTGSASWLLLTVLTQMYGVRGKGGNLIIEPKLVREQFKKSGNSSVSTNFRGKDIKVIFFNPYQLDYGEYAIAKVTINGEAFNVHNKYPDSVEIPSSALEQMLGKKLNIEIILSSKD